MELSIVVPAYKAKSYLKQSLPLIKSYMPRNSELIVVIDGDVDNSYEIAQQYADRVEVLPENKGHPNARNVGADLAQGKIIIFFDADVLIEPDTIDLISRHFEDNPVTAAVTGLLAKDGPHKDFFSRYKNFYMYYTFMRAPEDITFLYGSVHAIRKSVFVSYDTEVGLTDDTAMGQALSSQGKVIKLLKNLRVTHLKRHNLFSLARNDFKIPYDWAHVFIKHQGWKQLGKRGTGYAHAPTEQLISVMLVPAGFIILMSAIFVNKSMYLTLLTCLTLWFICNRKFLSYLRQEDQSYKWFVTSHFWTLFDHFIMSLGVGLGLLHAILIYGLKNKLGGRNEFREAIGR